MGLFHSYMKSVGALFCWENSSHLKMRPAAFSTSGSSVISSCETRNVESSPMFWWWKLRCWTWLPGGIFFYFPTMTSINSKTIPEKSMDIHEVSWLDLAGEPSALGTGDPWWSTVIHGDPWCNWWSINWPRFLRCLTWPKFRSFQSSQKNATSEVILRSDILRWKKCLGKVWRLEGLSTLVRKN